MSDGKTKIQARELEALIMKRLGENADCAGITHVYVKETGLRPPEETWVHSLVSRRPTIGRSFREVAAMQAVLKKMQKEFDLVLD